LIKNKKNHKFNILKFWIKNNIDCSIFFLYLVDFTPSDYQQK